MSFAIVNHNGTDLAVLLLEPNVRDNGSIRVDYAFATQIDEGGSGRESREPDHPDLRLRQTCFYTLTKAEAATLRARLAALGDTPIAVPLWSDKLTGANWDDRIHDAAIIARLSDGAVLESDAVLDDAETYAPLLVGRFIDGNPEGVPLSEESGEETEITVTEDSTWDSRVTINALGTLGEWPAELIPEYTEALRDQSEQGRRFEQIGRGRERAIEGQEVAFKWGQSADFELTSRAAIRSLLATFVAHSGRHESLSMPWWFKPDIDQPATPHETQVRFANDQIQLDFDSGCTARASLAFWQVPWEIEPPEGEEAAQPGRFFLYRHTLQTPVTPVVWRFTDYAEPITIDEGAGNVTYFPAAIEHDRIAQGFMLDDDPVTLKGFVADNHPWMLAIKRILEAPLTVEIFQVDPENPVPELRHSGELGEPKGKGRKLSMRSTVLGGQLEIPVPNFYIQEGCNHEFCGPGCLLDIADFTFEATVDAINGAVIDVTVTANPPGAAMGADYFANGDCEIGDALTFESREIIRSENLGAGQQRLTLNRAFRVLAVDDTITFRPTCSGTWSECSGFANTINYGGHRHVGPDNISVPARETNTNGGKK